MKVARLPVFGIALLILLSKTAPARADLIQWNYNWTPTPSVIYADAPGTSYIALTNEQLKSAIGNSNIVATNLRTYSTASAATPDTFTAKAYTLSLFLQDTSTGASGTLTFSGQFDGTISAFSSNVKNKFTGLTSQNLVLGTTLFTATISSYTPPGPTNASNAGSIGAFAQVSIDTVAIEDVPEPSSFLLAFLAAPIVGLALWRRMVEVSRDAQRSACSG